MIKLADLKTGMTCRVAKGNYYMIFVNKNKEVYLLPLDKEKKQIDTDIVLRTDMDENLIQNLDFYTTYDYYNSKIDPFQITTIWEAQDPLDLFHLTKQTVVWTLESVKEKIAEAREGKKEYEILQFSDGYNIFYKNKDKTYSINPQHKYTETELKHRRDVKIKKIRRLSDNQEFELGQLVQDKEDKRHRIVIVSFNSHDRSILTRGSIDFNVKPIQLQNLQLK